LEYCIQYENGSVIDKELISFHDNGNIKSTIPFEYGFAHGAYKEYYPTGELFKTLQYIHGTIIGHYSALYRSGQIKEKGYILNGFWHDDFYEYFEDGNVKEHKSIKNCWIDSIKAYTENGTIDYILKTEDEETGEIFIYDEDGNVKETKIIRLYPQKFTPPIQY
jgi:antitoxin component YwqK of YwqJK toxin-antitoxin module